MFQFNTEQPQKEAFWVFTFDSSDGENQQNSKMAIEGSQLELKTKGTIG